MLRNVVRLQELAGGAYATLYEDPASATAQLGAIAKRLDELSRIDESAPDGGARGNINIGIVEHNHGVLAAQLQHYRNQLRCRRLRHTLARGNASGEDQLIYARGDQRRSRRAIADDNLKKILRQPGFIHEPL